ncbi:MAG: UDP-N-acetylglucosamine--N-acetylmuramyl-(pentapeptide) pyrophosphoryl-undecaprenol, partial [Frankiaceae bacterium]|nr:UDP-N-acetylglucosamine--N-acetylmuramyl-(pentapeptide) pyrophosphoryl-undecaprenol [Frankiaceae bacterium]
QHIGTPLRTAITTLDRAAGRREACAAFGLDADKPTVLVFGGSQGARSINRAAAGSAAALTEAGFQVLHAAGAGNVDEVRAAVGDRPSYVVVPYLERMDLAYAAADVAVCRSGAMTCTELAAVGMPAVYVPLPHGNGEQRFNALPVVQAGGGVLVDDAALTPSVLVNTVTPLLRDPERLKAMSVAASGLGRRDGDLALARLVLAVAKGTR